MSQFAIPDVFACALGQFNEEDKGIAFCRADNEVAFAIDLIVFSALLFGFLGELLDVIFYVDNFKRHVRIVLNHDLSLVFVAKDVRQLLFVVV